MKRAGLSRLPIVKQIAVENQSTIKAQVIDDILILDKYNEQGEFNWRYFLDEEGNYFRVLADGKWSTAQFGNFYYMLERVNTYIDPTSLQTIKDFTGYNVDDDVLSFLVTLNRQRGEQMLAHRLNKIRAKLDEVMLTITPTPKRFDSYIKNELFKEYRYLFYTNYTTKTIALCSHCKQESNIPPATYGTTQRCPNCKSVCKLVQYGRHMQSKGFRNSINFNYIQPIKGEKEYWIRTFMVTQTTAKGQVNYNTLETNRTKTRGNTISTTHYVWERLNNIHEYRFVEDRHESYYNSHLKLYPHNLDRMFGERHHCKPSAIAKHLSKVDCKQLIKGIAMPLFENAFKLKFYCLAEAVQQLCAVSKSYHQNTIRKAYQLDKSDIAYLQKQDPSPSELSLYSKMKAKYKHNIEQVYQDIKAVYPTQRYVLIELFTHTELQQYLEYRQKQHKPDSRFDSDYIDYLTNAVQLEYDMKNKRVLFPFDFKQAHDRAYKEANERARELKQKKLNNIADMYSEYYKRFAFAYKDLIVVPPRNAEELRQEGEVLNHCVERYGEDVADRETIILFIRKADNPEQPFYTLNLNIDLELEQNRGKNNCGATIEVNRFTDRYLTHLQTKSKTKAV